MIGVLFLSIFCLSAKGKYGRILGEIVVDKEHGTYNVNQMLINEGHAKEYFGGKR